MRIAVVGGRLQGLEAAYLARKAGWEVVLIDIDQKPPARGICDRFTRLDVTRKDEAARAFQGVDIVIPALENRRVLKALSEAAAQAGIPVAFDPDAYAVSSSKLVSDKLFARTGIPAPLPWPECGFPAIAKPSGSSGSEGVVRIQDSEALESFRKEAGPGGWVIQEYLEGSSYSIEVIGARGGYRTFAVTELEMDDGYDCKRVLAPANLSAAHQNEFARIARAIAASLGLSGIMDVEVILHGNRLKVLEIDARLPSQTPAVVYHATGVNLLEALAESCLHGRLPDSPLPPDKPRAVIYEHIRVSPGRLAVSGEHIMAAQGPLSCREDFFGADEAITDYSPGKSRWAATLIITGSDLDRARENRARVIDRIRKEQNLECYLDPYPAVRDYRKEKGA